MPFISAKTILNSINILDQEEVGEAITKRKRHPKNEFQAFAYKLSKDLNDDKNLKIYMRLAKNVERSLMERAYSFAIDSNSEQKGRLFLWKLKLLRKEIQGMRDRKNHSYEFILKKMAKFRDDLAEQTYNKSIAWQSDELFANIDELLIENLALNKDSTKIKLKILTVGPIHEKFFLIKDCKNFSIEISGKMANLSKEKSPKTKIIKKDFLKNSFIDNEFDLIIVNSFWQFIPIESELKFIAEIKRVLKDSGSIIINLKESFEDQQEWKAMIVNNFEREYFIKNETNHSFRSVVEGNQLEIFKEHLAGPYVVYFLRIKNENANSLSNP